ncbi:hypothetical protein JHV675_52410 [Mycobacterium avium subsp. hominissuis]
MELHGCDDANLFVGVEKWRPGRFRDRFVAFEGSYGYGRDGLRIGAGRDRVSTGWQRVSLRALDSRLSRP